MNREGRQSHVVRCLGAATTTTAATATTVAASAATVSTTAAAATAFGHAVYAGTHGVGLSTRAVASIAMDGVAVSEVVPRWALARGGCASS